jgi:peptidoglycan/LPS O-acetylase OafA/YrhL
MVSPQAAAVDGGGGEGDPLEPPPTTVYRPYLDGLRCVAVYLVVLFHAGVGRFAGGYIGVDVFFVLSGFLVTQVLLRDLSGPGSIRFARFYARRFRRLLPAAFAALVGTALLFVVVDPVEALASVRSFQAAFLYSANWYFIGESTDYFGADVATNPVLQFWSLAVEEQFYLVWPLVLGGLFWVTRRLRGRQMLVVRLTVAAIALASVAWALHLRTDDPNRAYFGTDTRAYQLLAGAMIALLPAFVARLGRYQRVVRVVAPAAIVGLVVVGSSLADGDAIVRGVIATAVTVVVIGALESSTGGVAQWLLSTELAVYLGRISYGTYLWHWPVVLIATETLELDARAAVVLTCLVATGLASLSYHLLEQPVRQARLLDRHGLVVIGTSLGISVIAALVVIPTIIDPRPSEAAAPAVDAEAFTPVPSWFDSNAVYAEGFGLDIRVYGGSERPPSCVGAPAEQCTTVRGSGAHILLMGDSNAVMMMPAFTELAERNDLSLSIAIDRGCPWQRSRYRMGGEIQDQCRTMKEDAYTRLIPELDPDLIVVINAGSSDGIDPGEQQEADVEAVTAASLDELTEDGRTVVVIEPMPASAVDVDPLRCLADAAVVEECRFVAAPGPGWYETFLREQAAANPLVRSADLDRLACPFLPICDPIVGDVAVWWDGQHLTTRYSRTLADPLATYLRTNGLIDT